MGGPREPSEYPFSALNSVQVQTGDATCCLVQVAVFQGLLQLPVPVACDQDVAKADQHRVGVIVVHKEHANPCIKA